MLTARDSIDDRVTGLDAGADDYQARRISDSSLDTRLDVGNAAEELKLLAASFNELPSRLDRSFEAMRRFVADASHELRTPLSVIRGRRTSRSRRNAAREISRIALGGA